MASSLAIAGLVVALTAVLIFPYLDLDHPGAMGGDQAPLPVVLLDAAAAAKEVMLPFVAVQAFVAVLATVAFVYVRIHNGGGAGAASGARDRRIPEVMYFVLSVSISLLVVCLVPRPGPGAIAGGARAQAPSLGVIALHALPPSAALTFFSSVVLIHAHVRAVGVDASNGPIQADVAPVQLLAKMTLGATLACFMAIIAAFYAM